MPPVTMGLTQTHGHRRHDFQNKRTFRTKFNLVRNVGRVQVKWDTSDSVADISGACDTRPNYLGAKTH